ncbi:MAG: GAF domain-containing sensor histidine kinase [Planctomycetota bacterium]
MTEESTGQKQKIEALEHEAQECTSALEMLHDIASMANRAQSVQEAIQYCLRRVAEHDGWSFGHAFLPSKDDPNVLFAGSAWYKDDGERFTAFRDLTLKTTLRGGESLTWRVYATGEPIWTTDFARQLGPPRAKLARDLGIAMAAAFPVMVETRVEGVLEFFADSLTEFKPELLESMANVGTQLGRVIERKAFQDRLLTLAEEEHRRIGQELHDDVGQELTGLALTAETLAELLDADGGPPAQLARGILAGLDRTRRKTQALSRGLVPAEVNAPGLEAALDGLAVKLDEQEGISCRLWCDVDRRVVDGQTATQLYRIAQEAIINVLCPSGAKNVEILLENDDTITRLAVQGKEAVLPSDEDWGTELWLRIMRYRAALIGGTLSVEPSAAGGTWVTCRLPKSHS